MKKNNYLAPGFMVTMAKNGWIQFPLLDSKNMRATRPRLAIIDELNRGYKGTLDGLAGQVADQFKVPFGRPNNFLQTIASTEWLVSSDPASRFNEASVGVCGTVPDGKVTFAAPVGLLSQGGEYLWYDHQGDLVATLSMAEVLATVIFANPITVEDAWQHYGAQDYWDSLDRQQFDSLLSRLAGTELLVVADAEDDYKPARLLGAVDSDKIQSLVDARMIAHDEKVAALDADLVPVIPINVQPGTAPVSLAMVIGYAMDYDGGRLQEKYDFVPMFFTDESRAIERAGTTSIFLFSNYVWNYEENLAISAAVKAVNPNNITIHGGPSTPKYEPDAKVFFDEHPHIDITVRGEGEATLADLLDNLDLANSCDLDVLAEVPGLTYRNPNGLTRTADRERIADINTIPSPFLMGLLDDFGSVKAAAVIETNRGCPYGCTFCDWGSATLSKVRKYDLDRVYKELEWCAVHKIKEASIADANYGMLERDVQITEKIAELRKTYGYPGTVNINYAKNQVKYLRQIIEIMASANILAEGVVSLQTTDQQTLKIIARSNIKLEKYNELSTEFRQAGLPLAADIMMGLPGATPIAFITDLQTCTDRDIRVRANPTQLLPNSPMNAPAYRKEHGIVALPGETLMETATYTRDEWHQMDGLRMAYYLFDTYGLLRYVARFIRRETGMREVAFYDSVRSAVAEHPADWPVMTATLNTLEGYMAPPGSWAFFVSEVRRFVISHLKVADDSALRTALAVQLGHLPSPGRQFPHTLELKHDYAAWQEALFTAREAGHREDWEQHIPRLAEFGPATLLIRDHNEICRRDIGGSKYALDMNLRTWELDSSVARARLSIGVG